MNIHELTIGMYARTPDTFTAAYDDGTSGPHRGRREDAERDYTEANTATGEVRAAIENYRRDSAVFRPWARIHPDYRSNYLGCRHVLALDTRTGGTVLAPWLGPDALPKLLARSGSTIASSSGVILAHTEHHTLTY
jgi:hypothetical protein